MEIRTISIATDFRVSEDGVVYDSLGKPRPVYKNGDGYLGVSIKTNEGRWVTYGVHRLVAMEFVKNLKPGVRDQVNHFDRDKENNRRKNLDWVTDKENQIHADLYEGKSDRKRLVLRNPIAFGKSILVSNLREASEIIGISPRKIWDIVKGDDEHLVWEIEYLEYGARLPEDMKLSTITIRDSEGKNPKLPVLVKDLKDGTVSRFDSILQAARSLNVIPTAVRQAIIKDGKIRSLKRRYLVIRDGKEFPDVKIEDLVKHIPNIERPVVAYRPDGRKTFVFPSVIAFVDYSGLSKRVVWRKLKNDDLELVGGWSVTFKNGSSEDAVLKILSYLGIKPNCDVVQAA